MTKRTMDGIWKCLEELRKIEPEMPIQRASTFIYVAAHEGSTIRQVSEAVGVVLSTTNRNLRALGNKHRNGSAGFDLVFTEKDPIDCRRLVVKLTNKGIRVRKSLADYLEPKGAEQ